MNTFQSYLKDIEQYKKARRVALGKVSDSRTRINSKITAELDEDGNLILSVRKDSISLNYEDAMQLKHYLDGMFDG